MTLETADPVDLYVGDQIRLRRRALRMSQSELGKACNVSFQQMQKYENSRNRVSASTLFAIAQALHCEPDAFFPQREGQPLEASPLVLRVSDLMPEVLLIADLSAETQRALGSIIRALVGIQPE